MILRVCVLRPSRIALTMLPENRMGLSLIFVGATVLFIVRMCADIALSTCAKSPIDSFDQSIGLLFGYAADC